MINQLAYVYLSLAELVEPVRRRIANPESLEAFFYRYGWAVTLTDDGFLAASQQMASINAAIEQFVQTADMIRDKLEISPAARMDLEDVQSLSQTAKDLILQLNDFKPTTADSLPAPLDSTGFWASISEHLFDDLLEEHLRVHQPGAYALLRLWGVVRFERLAPRETHRRPYTRISFDWQQLLSGISNPLSALKNAYQWGTEPAKSFDDKAFLQALADVLRTLRLSVQPIAPSLRRSPELPSDSTVAIASHAEALKTTLACSLSDTERRLYEIGCELFPAVRTGQPRPAGLLLKPILRAGATQELPLGEEFKLTWHADADASDIAGISIFPDAVELLQDQAVMNLRLDIASTRPSPWYLLGSPRTARIELNSPVCQLSVAGTAEAPEVRLRLAAGDGTTTGCRAVFPLDESDAFLEETIKRSSVDVEFSLEILWSSTSGLSFNGRPDIDFSLPSRRQLGFVSLSNPSIALTEAPQTTGQSGISCHVGVDISGRLGPVSFAAEKLGFVCRVMPYEREDLSRLPATADVPVLGRLGLELQFAPPEGLALAISAPTVTGGGFLRFDPAKQEYSGVLQLEIAETVAVKAVGLLTTRMPDGSRGYSLVILITAEDFAPIQLGFGFTLTGIGGLLGVHRSTAVDTLRSGLKNGTLGSFLFPADPIRNAPQIVSDLRAVFPAVRDRHVFGPMAQIEWGSPTILTIQLALILELPEPVRLIVLGRLMADLPDAGHSLVRLRMDAVGVIDFNRDEIALDATLYDSRILEFALSGDMALRANWGSRPDFVLAVGGFNPRYPVPAGFPRLRRLTLSLGDGDNPRLRFESYLALTSNTVQFGGRLDFAYSAAGFTLAGFLGADALFQFEPFAFVTDVGALVALKRGGSTLMSIGLEATLAGPTPWHIWGKARFKILFFTVKIGFDHRFGHDQPPPLPEPVDALALLVQALNDRRNWNSVLPRGEPAVVTLREAAAGRLHPLAELSVRQRVVPLNRTVTRFGNAPLASGPAAFEVRASDGLSVVYLQESFAPAQYQDYSDDDKLAQPAFERYDAGLDFGNEDLAYPDEALADSGIVYETEIIDPTRPPDQPRPPVYPLPTASLLHMVDYGAAAQAPIRRGGANRYRSLEPAA